MPSSALHSGAVPCVCKQRAAQSQSKQGQPFGEAGHLLLTAAGAALTTAAAAQAAVGTAEAALLPAGNLVFVGGYAAVLQAVHTTQSTPATPS
jgi:hypothetical protein